MVLLGRGGHANTTKNCKLVTESEKERSVLSLLEPLTNHNFSVETQEEEESYTYQFQVCGDAGGKKGAGLVQKDKEGKTTVVGMYTSTKVMGGLHWVMLRYENGTNYRAKHCSGGKRNAIIMIFCDRNVEMGPLSVIVENREREDDCFYLFQLDSSVVCPPLKSQLSVGSIILIVGFCLLAAYLIGGFLYQRLVVGAKGMEQFPNYAFWVEFGNMAADGCDFVCRTRGSREEPPTYRGVPTEPVEEAPEERDDHLLPI